MANTKITPHVLDSTLISGHSTVTAATNDFVLIQDVSDSNALKKALVSDLAQNEESPTFTGNVTVDSSAQNPFVVNTTNSDGPLQIFKNSGTVRGYIGNAEGAMGQGTANIAIRAEGALVIGTNGNNERMRIQAGGNVGIGTTGPAYPLEVKLDQSVDWLSRFYNEGTTEGDNGVLFRTGSEHDGTITLAAYSGSSYKFVVAGDGHVSINGTANASADGLSQMTIGSGSGDSGLSIYSGANNTSRFMFADGTSGGASYDGFMAYQHQEQLLGFGTAGTGGYRMVINSNGTILGATSTAPSYPGTFTSARTGNSATTTQNTWGFNAHAGGNAIDFGIKTSGSGSYAVGVINHGETTWMSRLDYSGAIHLTNTTVQNISDRRLKKDIVDANSQWNDIKALQFKNFKWKDEARGTDTYLGLIADEVESVSPGLVGIDAISAETMPEDGIDPEYKNVKYSIVWMKAVKALQEAMTKIETLETKVAELEG